MQISSSPTFGVLLKTLSATQLVDINGGLVARARGPGSLLKRITFRVQPTCLLGYLISNILSSSQFNKTRRLVKASVADRARATSKFDGKALRNHASSLISHFNNDTCQSSEQGEDYSDGTPSVLSVEQQILPAALARAVEKFEASEFERRINDEWVDLTMEPNTKSAAPKARMTARSRLLAGNLAAARTSASQVTGSALPVCPRIRLNACQ